MAGRPSLYFDHFACILDSVVFAALRYYNDTCSPLLSDHGLAYIVADIQCVRQPRSLERKAAAVVTTPALSIAIPTNT